MLYYDLKLATEEKLTVRFCSITVLTFLYTNYTIFKNNSNLKMYDTDIILFVHVKMHFIINND